MESNGNKSATCKLCGNQLKCPKLEEATALTSKEGAICITPLIEEPAVQEAYSVRVRPQGPDYRCFVSKSKEGNWKCGFKHCEVSQQGRDRSSSGRQLCPKPHAYESHYF